MTGIWKSAIAALLLGGCVPAAPLQGAAPAPSESIRGVNTIGITVSDIDDTLAFYSAAVPYELVERVRVPASSFPAEILTKRDGEVEIAVVRTPTVFLRLVDVDPDQPAAPVRRPVIGPGYTHICFQSPATAPAYDRFKALGLDILSRGDGPVDLGGYGVTYAYGFDNDGIMIEMEQLSPAVMAASGELGVKRSKHAAWATHIANVTGDMQGMVEFYTKVLGYGPRRVMEPTRRDTFDAVVDLENIQLSASWFDAGNFELEFWHYSEPKTPLDRTPKTLDAIGYNSIIFEVTDLAGTLERLKEAGLTPIGQTVSLGEWRMRFLRDPEGNLVAFQEQLPGRPDRSIEDLRWIAESRASQE